MHTRDLLPLDAAAMAALWHSGALESGARDPGFLPRMPVAEYANQVSAQLAEKRLFGWGVYGEQHGELHAYLTAKMVAPSAEWQQDGHLYVLDVDVHVAQRRKGYATHLLGLAIAHARRLGISRVELSWLATDPRSSAMWSKLGFRPYLHRGYLHVGAEE
jgi:ribosomal protein S18 acetylase RimI-like enzyme